MNSSATASANNQSLEYLLADFAKTSLEKFTIFFGKVRETFPAEVARGCLTYLAENPSDQPGKQMIVWLCRGEDYLNHLLDPTLLSEDSARRVLAIFRNTDPQFLVKFSKITGASGADAHRVRRALAVVDGLGDFNVLLPWFRALTHNPDERIRSKATKVLCSLRPNKAMIERQLQSDDERVRANAVEAMWGTTTLEAEHIFNSVLADSNHRVVGNALVGLHLLKDQSAFEKITEFTKHPSPTFRRAMTWVLAYIQDNRAIPVLESMRNDASPVVREKATQARAKYPHLLELESMPGAGDTTSQDAPVAVPVVPAELLPNNEEKKKSPNFVAPAFRTL